MKSNENEENQTSVGITLTSRHEFSSDKDELAWDFYLKYYGEFLFKNEEEEFIFKHGSRKIQVNGDVSFNIVPTSFDGKRRLYESILNETNVSDVLKNSLEVMRYSPMNISILPMTGGLNNTKKSLGNDRFDTFAYFINQYYEGFKTPIINAGSLTMGIRNRLFLEEFLDSYNSAIEFFEDIYGIEKHFVKTLIKSGKCTITKKEDYCYYLKLAHDYWKSRLNQKKIQDYLDEGTIEKYQNHLNTILNEIEILENSINKQ
ncbi:hypothetical protein [Streptococcus oralis]|uniref:hypothetical protein n=1 Tax=Streptococcus oralis TaxID=1303 RepID=UPI00300F2B2C